jgi:hypothetical protein
MIPNDTSIVNKYKSTLSDQKLGDLNPAKRPEVRQKIKDSLLSRKSNFVILNLSKESLLEEISNLFSSKANNIKSISSYLSHNTSLAKEIERHTPFLVTANTNQRLYHLRHNLVEQGKCLTCCSITKFENYAKGYRSWCSVECVQNSTQIQDKKKKTSFQNYGAEYALQSELIQNRKKQTNLERFGVEEPLKCDTIKEKIKQTNLERFGVENPFELESIQEKIRVTNLERYGVAYPLQNKEVQEKTKQTNLERYGVENPAKSVEVQEKTKQTCLERYGVENPAKSAEVQERIKQTNLERFGFESPFKNKEIRDKTNKKIFQKTYFKLLHNDKFSTKIRPLFLLEDFKGVEFRYKFQCLKCENVFEDNLRDGKIPRCCICFPHAKSILENNIHDFLKLCNVPNISRNSKSIIPPLELDLYLPNHKLAIEFNGVFWHSENSPGGTSPQYHLNKTKLCEEKGIQLLHIFEDEWIEKQEIVKSIIKNKLGLIENKIYARNCEIRDVSNEEAYNFLFDNHLQTPVNSKHNFGLYTKDNELMYLIGLSKPRFNKKYEYELVRSCPRISTSVIGGFSKLLNYAVKTLQIKSLVSYVDKRYFTGSGYNDKNWKLAHETTPNYFYTTGNVLRESRVKFQKHKLKHLFPDLYDAKLTEWQIMQLAGYDRIWDCGNLVFELIIQ